MILLRHAFLWLEDSITLAYWFSAWDFQSGHKTGLGLCIVTVAAAMPAVAGQREAPTRTKCLQRCHGKECLCTLQQFALTVLTVGQGDTYGGSGFSLHTFCCCHGCFLWAPKKGLGPCLWATSICWFLALKSGESSAIHPQYILEIWAVLYGWLCQLSFGME